MAYVVSQVFAVVDSALAGDGERDEPVDEGVAQGVDVDDAGHGEAVVPWDESHVVDGRVADDTFCGGEGESYIALGND